MGDQTIQRPQPCGDWLVGPQKQFLDGDLHETMLFQGGDELADLVCGGHDAAEEAAGLQRLPCLRQIPPGLSQIEETGVNISLVEACGDVGQLQIDIIEQSDALQIAAGQGQHLGTLLVGVDSTVRHHGARQCQREPTAAGACFHDATTWVAVKPHGDVGGVFGEDDLRHPLDALDEVIGRGFQCQEGMADLSVQRAPQRLSDELIVVQQAAVGMPLASGFEPDQKALAIIADEQDEITSLGGSHRSPLDKASGPSGAFGLTDYT